MSDEQTTGLDTNIEKSTMDAQLSMMTENDFEVTSESNPEKSADVAVESEKIEDSPPEAKMTAADEGEITVIPDRVYFRIGDVAEITGIKPYVLRFWEKEFDLLKPVKNNSGQRIYRKKDVESVLLIKRLLYRERYSIEGAKKRIKDLRKQKSLAKEKRKRGELDESKLEVLANIRSGLNDLIQLASKQ